MLGLTVNFWIIFALLCKLHFAIEPSNPFSKAPSDYSCLLPAKSCVKNDFSGDVPSHLQHTPSPFDIYHGAILTEILNTPLGTLAVDGWTVTFGTVRMALGGA